MYSPGIIWIFWSHTSLKYYFILSHARKKKTAGVYKEHGSLLAFDEPSFCTPPPPPPPPAPVYGWGVDPCDCQMAGQEWKTWSGSTRQAMKITFIDAIHQRLLLLQAINKCKDHLSGGFTVGASSSGQWTLQASVRLIMEKRRFCVSKLPSVSISTSLTRIVEYCRNVLCCCETWVCSEIDVWNENEWKGQLSFIISARRYRHNILFLLENAVAQTCLLNLSRGRPRLSLVTLLLITR